MTHNTTTTRTGTTDTQNLDVLVHRAPATDDLLILADWLASHGAAHLSTIECIELAERLITRRRFIIGAGGLLGAAALGACGVSEEAVAPTATPGATRTFRHFAGTTEVPSNPQRIVTLQDQNALLPLLELGVTPVGSVGVSNKDGPGGTFRRVKRYDTSEVEYVGDINEPNLEAVAAQAPDLIVGVEEHEEVYDVLSEIAPTVLIQIVGRPLTEVLDDFARLVGREDRHTELEAEYRQAIDDLVAGLPAPPEEITLSYIHFFDSATFLADSGQAVGTVLEDVGFARPEPQPQSTSEEGVYVSLEKLPAHDTDVMIVPDYSGDSEELGQVLQEIQDQPLFQQLDVVQRGEYHVFDGLEMVGSAFGKMQNFISFLNSILVERAPTLSNEETNGG